MERDKFILRWRLNVPDAVLYEETFDCIDAAEQHRDSFIADDKALGRKDGDANFTYEIVRYKFDCVIERTEA